MKFFFLADLDHRQQDVRGYYRGLYDSLVGKDIFISKFLLFMDVHKVAIFSSNRAGMFHSYDLKLLKLFKIFANIEYGFGQQCWCAGFGLRECTDIP